MEQKGIIKYFILPKEASEVELRHVRKINKIALWFCVGHLPLFIAVALAAGTPVQDALIYGGLLIFGPFLADKTLSNPRTLSLVYGFTSMGLGALLVHLGQSPVQIEMHFHFFASLALLAVWGNPLIIWVATVTVALHHLGFWYFIPQSVFNYDAAIWVVLIHAAFVVCEAIAASFIARNFFDNVIGLEKIITARTAELDAKNTEMKLILDNTAQGFMTVNVDGTMSAEKSAIIESWFGKTSDAQKIGEYLGRIDTDLGELFEFCLGDFNDDGLPLDYCIENMPKKVAIHDCTYAFHYKPLMNGEKVEALLMVVSDITTQLAQEQSDAIQLETIGIFNAIMKDRTGFMEYLETSEKMVHDVADLNMEKEILFRELHTIKGNSGAFSVTSIASLCHQIESNISDNAGVISDVDRKELRAAWDALKHRLAKFLHSDRENLEIEVHELQEAINMLKKKEPQDKVVSYLNTWHNEPMRRRLGRIGSQIQNIAKRLNKPPIELVINDNSVRVAKEQLQDFWGVFSHVIRNAVDHGIESSEERVILGKPQKGSIELGTEYRNGNLIITVKDDGRGIDWEMIKEKAAKQNLKVNSQQDLISALFADGLSTVEKATLYSGRGVGLSAVHQICQDLGGEISIESEKNKGTTFVFTFENSKNRFNKAA